MQQSSFLDYLQFHKGQQISSPAKNSHNRSSKPSYDSIVAADSCFPQELTAPSSKILVQQKGSSPEGYKNIMLAAHPHKKRSKSNKSKQSIGGAATEGDELNGKSSINYQINNFHTIESAQDSHNNYRENRAIHTEQPLEKLINSELWPRKRQSQANAQLCQMFERSVLFSPSKTLLSATQFSCNHQVPSVKVENPSISKRSVNQSALVMSSNPLIKPILSQSSNRKLASTCYTLTTEWQIPTTATVTAKVQTRNPKDRYNPVRSSLDVYPTYHSENAQRRNSYNKSVIAEALTSSRGVTTMHDSLRVSVNLATKTKNDLDVLLCKNNNSNNRVGSGTKKSNSGITNKSTCVKNSKNDKKSNSKTRNKSLEKVSLSMKSTGSSATRDNKEVKKTAASARQFPDSTNSISTQSNKFTSTSNTQTTSNNDRESNSKQQNHKRENSKDPKGSFSSTSAATSSIAVGNNSATTISTAATASNIFSFSSSSQSSSKTAKTQQNSLNQLLNSLLRATRTEPRSPIGQPPKPNQSINQQQMQPNQKKRVGSSLLSSVSHTQPDERNYLPFKYSEQQNDQLHQRQPYLSQVQCNNLIGINPAPRFDQKYQFSCNINKNFTLPSGKFVDNTRPQMNPYVQRFEDDMRAFQEYNESISKNELFVANLKHPFFSSSITHYQDQTSPAQQVLLAAQFPPISQMQSWKQKLDRKLESFI